MLGLLLLSIGSSSVMAAAADYLPDDEDVEGYDLIWEHLYESEDPIDPEETMTAGAQIWAKNDTANNVIAVIGSVVVEVSENPLMQDIPTSIMSALQLMPSLDGLLEDVDTWWDLLTAVLTSMEDIEDITTTIGTTAGSIEFNNTAYGYMIFSVDAGVLIWSFSFSISAEWFDLAEGTAAELETIFNDLLTGFQALIGAWMDIINSLSSDPWSSSSLPLETSATVPTGDETDDSDVQGVTTAIGSQYSAGIPGYSPLILFALLGGFGIYLVKRKKIAMN